MQELLDGVTVVGAGVGGMTLAAALRRGRMPVEVVVDSGNPPIDGGLCLWGGALAALDRIGLLAAVAHRGVPINRLRLSDDQGRVLLEVSARETPRTVEGVAIRAARFFEVVGAAAAGVEFHHAGGVLGYGEDGRGVMLTLGDGSSLHTTTAIGADGPASRMRLQCLDDGPPLYSGDSMWEGVAAGIRWLKPGTVHLYWGRYGVRGGAVVVDRKGHAAWWVDLDTGPLRWSGERSHKDELRHLLAELRGPLRDLLEETAERDITHADVFARRDVRLGGKGCVTLLGDAGHPVPSPLRLSASTAVEDAVALAEAMRAEANPEAALRGYERARLPRLTWITRTIWRLRAYEARYSATAGWARNAGARTSPRRFVQRLLSRLLTDRTRDLR